MTTYYTVDIGTNLPYPLPDELRMTQAPAVIAIMAGKTSPKRADAEHWRKLPSGYQVIHNKHLFNNRALAERLLETLNALYAAQQAREAALVAEREEKHRQTLETLTALAEQFPKYPDHKPWEVVEGKYWDEFVIHLTPEESEGLARECVSHILRYHKTDVLFVSNFEGYNAKTALIREQEMQDEDDAEETETFFVTGNGRMTNKEYETYRFNRFVAHAREILATLTGNTP